ncbi:MAG: nitroreductase [Pseudomonadales bacterium]|jgi:nitroreductase|nr:nitroreductase [Pseudomonadales bacterium]
MTDTLELLLTRRSVKAIEMVEPGPTDGELDLILRAAARVPDHGKLGPWRFVRFTGDARRAFGDVLVDAWRAANPGDDDARVELERGRFLRAPVVVAVISSILPEHKIPEWEQVLSAGAVCMNMLTATHASGYVAQWLTEWIAYDARVGTALGLGPDERVAGFIYIGSPLQEPKERVRPDLEERIRDWTP